MRHSCLLGGSAWLRRRLCDLAGSRFPRAVGFWFGEECCTLAGNTFEKKVQVLGAESGKVADGYQCEGMHVQGPGQRIDLNEGRGLKAALKVRPETPRFSCERCLALRASRRPRAKPRRMSIERLELLGAR